MSLRQKSARQIILTDEGPGADTETRWDNETTYLMELMRNAFSLRSDMLVLDYGCGIGRIAKAIIDASNCSVTGVDISANMRTLATDYVGSERFIAVSPSQFDVMVGAGMRVPAALAIWVLQHCFAPAIEIDRIRRSLASESKGFILNMPKRAVPAILDNPSANGGFTWASDNIDVAALVHEAFHVEAENMVDTSRVPNMSDAGAIWMSFSPRRN